MTTGSASATATMLSITWGDGGAIREPRRHERSDPALDMIHRGRPSPPVGVLTLWAMYLVLFVGTALQWLLQ